MEVHQTMDDQCSGCGFPLGVISVRINATELLCQRCFRQQRFNVWVEQNRDARIFHDSR